MLIFKSRATLGSIPIITNSAIPNPSVPEASASKLFFHANNLFLPVTYLLRYKNYIKKVYIIHMIEILFKKMAGTSEVLPANVRPALPSCCQAVPKNEGHGSFHVCEPAHAK